MLPLSTADGVCFASLDKRVGSVHCVCLSRKTHKQVSINNPLSIFALTIFVLLMVYEKNCSEKHYTRYFNYFYLFFSSKENLRNAFISKIKSPTITLKRWSDYDHFIIIKFELY